MEITPYNCEDIERINEIAVKHNIHVKASSYMYPPIRLEKELEGYGNRLSPKDSACYSVKWDCLKLSNDDFKKRAESLKNLISVEESECYADIDSGVKCRAGSTAFWMTWDGQMRPCGMMPGPTTYPLEVGFEKAWDELREKTKQIKQPAKCVSCSKKDICGACAAVCVAETGEFDQVPEYMCQRTDEIVRQTVEMAKKM